MQYLPKERIQYRGKHQQFSMNVSQIQSLQQSDNARCSTRIELNFLTGIDIVKIYQCGMSVCHGIQNIWPEQYRHTVLLTDIKVVYQGHGVKVKVTRVMKPKESCLLQIYAYMV